MLEIGESRRNQLCWCGYPSLVRTVYAVWAYRTRVATYWVGQKMAPFIVRVITSPNSNRFSKFFYCHNQGTICNETVTRDPTTSQVCRYTRLPREMSDDALKPATPLTSCMINVDRAWHVAPKQFGLEFGRLCCSGCPSTGGLSMLTIYDS